VGLDYGREKFEVRFGFPWYELKEKLQRIMPSVNLIYVNQSEQAANFKALATVMLPQRRIPIVSYFHYVPIEPPHQHFDFLSVDKTTEIGREAPSDNLRFDQSLNNNGMSPLVFMRQIEALLASDFSATCSEFGVRLILDSARKIVPSVSPNMVAIPPPLSINESSASQSVEKANGNLIVFNHRLYSHYGPKEFFGFMDWFYGNVRQDFTVLLTDPTHGRSSERDVLNPSVNRMREELMHKPYVTLQHSGSREDYYRTLGKSKISIGPFKPSALWSMSAVDSMASGLPVLCPNYACFPEIVGQDSGMLFSTPMELSDLIQRFFDDKSFYQQASQYARDRAQCFRVEETARKFISLFEGAIENGK
jgi:glycosyltransferase involved in cell wall biosynthesis